MNISAPVWSKLLLQLQLTQFVPTLNADMCSVGGVAAEVPVHSVEPDVVVKLKVAPASFLSTENDLQAAL